MCARHILANWSKKWRGIERRKKFWAYARSTFEAQFRYNLEALSKLGRGIVEDLIGYNKDRWCKAYFNTFFKCDSMDNNMAESFKIIISMLEEIRIKVMTRVSRARKFADSWTDDISPMTMMVFNANIEKSMQCNIDWNGDQGFEVTEGEYKHTVNWRQNKCSCRSWELKGIPCAHGALLKNRVNIISCKSGARLKNRLNIISSKDIDSEIILSYVHRVSTIVLQLSSIARISRMPLPVPPVGNTQIGFMYFSPDRINKIPLMWSLIEPVERRFENSKLVNVKNCVSEEITSSGPYIISCSPSE
ncbi:putative nuclease HARBI1-like [Capsicum annuum]|nr:putative nuclease HARBI1-like [Capsicum annuum]